MDTSTQAILERRPPRQVGPVATSHVLQGTWQLDGGPGVANNPQLQMMTDRLTQIRRRDNQKRRFFEGS